MNWQSWWPLAASYLLGSLPFGLWLPLLVKGQDVRTAGSGNIGSTNVIRTAGKGIGAAVQILDVLKGVAAGWLCRRYLGLEDAPLAAALGTLFAVIGHCYPVWLKFKGGKGVNAALGGTLTAAWPAALLSLSLFGAIFLKTRTVSLAAMAASCALPLFAALLRLALGPTQAGYAAALAIVPSSLLILWRHRENIARLRAGTELSFKKPGA